jgi:hypothetical protein
MFSTYSFCSHQLTYDLQLDAIHTHHEATMKPRSHATEFKIITIGQLPIIWSTPTYPKMVHIFGLFFSLGSASYSRGKFQIKKKQQKTHQEFCTVIYDGN